MNLFDADACHVQLIQLIYSFQKYNVNLNSLRYSSMWFKYLPQFVIEYWWQYAQTKYGSIGIVVVIVDFSLSIIWWNSISACVSNDKRQ